MSSIGNARALPTVCGAPAAAGYIIRFCGVPSDLVKLTGLTNNTTHNNNNSNSGNSSNSSNSNAVAMLA